MKILGIDPGLQITGYGVIQTRLSQPALLDAGVIRLTPRAPLPARLGELEAELQSLFEEHHPDVCAVELLYSHYKHPRTAILMGHARGVILLVAQRFGVTIEQFSANRVKQSVSGNGHASKVQMQKAIQREWNLHQAPSPPDVADALAIALCCARRVMPLVRPATERASPRASPPKSS